MILPVLVSGYYLYCLVLEEETFKVVNSFSYKLPYVPNYSESLITQKKLIEAVSSLTKKAKLNRDDLLVVSDQGVINNIDVDLLLKDVISNLPVLACMLGHYSQSDCFLLDKEDSNHLATQLYLNDEIDDEIKLKIDKDRIKKFLNDNIKGLKSIDNILVCNEFASDSYKKKIESVFISELASVLEAPVALGIGFDYKYENLLKFGAILNSKKNIKEYLKTSDLLFDIKILFVPNATNAEYSIIAEGSKDKVKEKTLSIKPDFLNMIDIPSGDYIKIKITGSKVKFSGEFHSGSAGLAVYSRGN